MITYILNEVRIWVIEMLVLIVLAEIAGMALIAFSIIYFRLASKFHHPQPVTCPLNGGIALVHVAALKSALRRMGWNVQPSLSECSLWPERKGCAQKCAAQLTHLFRT
jgi:hypothetical protein